VIERGWRQYQEEAAAFFREMGYAATVNCAVQGVRALHAVDVFVQFDAFGLRFRWIIECKQWQTKIRKEKIAALRYIIDDVGADRGFLVSEAGFQPGAVKAAEKTNITLTSLAELRHAAQNDLAQQTLQELRTRAAKLLREGHGYVVEEKLSEYSGRFSLPPGVDGQQFMHALGTVSILQMAVDELLMGAETAFLPSLDRAAKGARVTRSEFVKRAPVVLGEVDDVLSPLRRR
jgi:hypothetical protein